MLKNSLKILMLMNRVPYPLNDGGAIGSFQFVKGYAEAGCELSCLVMNTSKHFVNEEIAQNHFKKYAKTYLIPIDNQIKPLHAFKNIFKKDSYILSRFRSVLFEAELKRILETESFDVIHIDGLQGGLYLSSIKKISNAKIVQRAHNVEHIIWKRAAESESNPLKKVFLTMQSDKLRNEERTIMQSTDCVLSISIEDDDFVKQFAPNVNTRIVPAGLDIDKSMTATIHSETDLFFIGSFDWLPNTQGIDWFLENCWDKIHTTFPTLKFYIAGKKMPEKYKLLGKNIVAVGEVPNANEYINAHQIMIVPLISGSGVRIKIIEAFAQAKCVLATEIAAEGSFATNEKDILIANDADTFIKYIDQLLSSKISMKLIAENALQLVKQRFDNQTNMRNLVEYYKTLCN